MTHLLRYQLDYYVRLTWVVCYLRRRNQQVLIGDTASAEVVIEYGVPQESVLGPKLYSLYTKPLADVIRHHQLDYLTRFNKIANQGAPQMAVDKEANSLSRVYSYYSKFNLCLFYA